MLRDKTILAVDDDAEVLHIVGLALEEAGYRVLMAADGCQALNAVEHGMPDLIILDMRMPRMGGCAFAGEFKAKYGAQAPIVLLSAEMDIDRRAEEIGAVGWIRKPFDFDKLVAVVNGFLD